MFSKTCTYGIQAMVYLASLPGTDYTSIQQIAEILNIPFHFLKKILTQFVQANLLLSARGVNGGVKLARPSKSISVYDLVLAIDGAALFSECVLHLPHCGNDKPCALHNSWAEERVRLTRIFQTTTLEEVSAGVANQAVRVALPQKPA